MLLKYYGYQVISVYNFNLSCLFWLELHSQYLVKTAIIVRQPNSPDTDRFRTY